jgi:uncharacterized protein with HEPN domain
VEQYLGGRTTGLDEALFWSDQRTQDAVLRRMETLADAASHLSDTLKARHPTIPWRQINFRNVLAHAYTEIRLDRVWQVIEGDLPQLRTVIDQELGRDELG